MGRFRFLHAADIHLDSPLRGLEADPDAPVGQIRDATRGAFRKLIDLAIDERVAFVVIAGDLYDGDWQDYRTGRFLVEQAARLDKADIRLFILKGNHDAASVITRHLRLPENTHVFKDERPETVILPQFGVALHGRSFPTKAVNEDLTADYPGPAAGLFNIGLLHTALGNTDHDDYAPTTVEALIAKGYDYWALGHVHARTEIARSPCWIVFPGNLQGRHIKESGAKGASLVTVADGRVAAVEHRPLDVLRWARLTVDLAPANDEDQAFALIGQALAAALGAADGRPLAARMRLEGRTKLHDFLTQDPERLRQGVVAESRQLGAELIWIESVVCATAPILDLEALSGRPDAVGRLVRLLDDIVACPPPDLLGAFPEELRNRLRGVELPPDHGLSAGLSADFMCRIRDIVLARLAVEA